MSAYRTRTDRSPGLVAWLPGARLTLFRLHLFACHGALGHWSIATRSYERVGNGKISSGECSQTLGSQRPVAAVQASLESAFCPLLLPWWRRPTNRWALPMSVYHIDISPCRNPRLGRRNSVRAWGTLYTAYKQQRYQLIPLEYYAGFYDDFLVGDP